MGSLWFSRISLCKTKEQTLLMGSGQAHGLVWKSWKLLCFSPTASTAHSHLCLIKKSDF